MRPIDPAHFVELHKRLGLALWHLQAFEDCLCKYIVIILKLPPSRAEDEMIAILRKLESKTFGQLMTELKKANTTSSVSELERRLDRLLIERNWLVHKSWAQHHTDLHQPDRLPPLYDRLNALSEEASAFQGFFTDLTTRWVVAEGIATPEQINEATQATLRERGAAE